MIKYGDDFNYANKPGPPAHYHPTLPDHPYHLSPAPHNAGVSTTVTTPPLCSRIPSLRSPQQPPQQHFPGMVDDEDDVQNANQPGASVHYHPNYSYPHSLAPDNAAVPITVSTPPPRSRHSSKRSNSSPPPPPQQQPPPPHNFPMMVGNENDIHYAPPGAPTHYHPDNYLYPLSLAPNNNEAPTTFATPPPPSRHSSKRHSPSPSSHQRPTPPTQKHSQPHYLPKMIDNEEDVHYANQSAAPADHYHPGLPSYPYPTSPDPNNAAVLTTIATPPPSHYPSKSHSPTPPPQQPQPPSPPSMTPAKPHYKPPSPPPMKLTPPQKLPSPSQPYYDSDYHRNQNPIYRRIFAVIITLLILLGVTAFVLWLIYRPHKPKFTTISTAIYSFNITPLSYITTTMQVTVLARNTNKHTSLYYDRLTVTIHYKNNPITPPVNLPPLHHRKGSIVMISPLLGGAPVPVPPDLTNGILADQAYGVVGLSWVLMGRAKYRTGWLKTTGHDRVYVRCDCSDEMLW